MVPGWGQGAEIYTEQTLLHLEHLLGTQPSIFRNHLSKQRKIFEKIPESVPQLSYENSLVKNSMLTVPRSEFAKYAVTI